MPNRIVAFFTRARPPSPDDTSIGAILLGLGFITKEQLLSAITRKLRSSGEALIGEILIAEGAVTRVQLDRALLLQRERRGGVDYVKEIKTLVAGVHARSESMQAALDEVRVVAEAITRDPPKLLPLKKQQP